MALYPSSLPQQSKAISKMSSAGFPVKSQDAKEKSWQRLVTFSGIAIIALTLAIGAFLVVKEIGRAHV